MPKIDKLNTSTKSQSTEWVTLCAMLYALCDFLLITGSYSFLIVSIIVIGIYF